MMMPFTLASDTRTVGTFVKTDSTQTVEILGLCGLDYAVLDAEHAPFDRQQLNAMLLAARAAGLPLLVRIPDCSDATILNALDLGAAGLVVPHVDSADQARDIVAASRFIDGRRGLSLSPRFAGYGTMSREAAVSRADQTPILCQIESPQAIEAVEDIAAISGITGLVAGRLDLALAMGAGSPHDPAVAMAVKAIATAGEQHKKVVVAAVGHLDEVEEVASLGVTSFIVGSDQALLREAAANLASAKRADPASA